MITLPPQLLKLQNWLETRDQKQRAWILAGALLFLLFFWYLLFASSLINKNAKLSLQIQSSKLQIAGIKAQTDTLLASAREPASVALLEQNANLKQQLANINQQLNMVLQTMIPPAEMISVFKSILADAKNLSLINLGNSPIAETTAPTPVPTADKTASNTKPANQINNEILYMHSISLEFHGDFFSTLHYLQSLEQLHWRFFWDGLDYQVSTYPAAKITIKIHTLSTKENLLNV